MNKFVITCCSTADMPKEYFEKRNIPYVCFHCNINGKEYADDLGISIPFDKFYKMIDEGAMPTTSQVNVAQFIEFFEPFLINGEDILHLSLSSGLPGSSNAARIAKDELDAKYPDRKIKIVDSLGASSGYGLLLDTLYDMKDEGKDIEEIYLWAQDNKLNVHHWFFSSDLSHFKRGGRISGVAAIAGTVLGICPLMNMNYEGKLTPRQKIKGKNKVIKEAVEKMKEFALDRLDYSGKCFISHSACYDDAKKVADLIEASFPKLNGKVMINNIGTVIGSHTGPGTVALYFFGDKRTN